MWLVSVLALISYVASAFDQWHCCGNMYWIPLVVPRLTNLPLCSLCLRLVYYFFDNCIYVFLYLAHVLKKNMTPHDLMYAKGTEPNSIFSASVAQYNVSVWSLGCIYLLHILYVIQ